MLVQLSDLSIDPKQVERLCHAIGRERIEEREASRAEWEAKTLVERDRVAPGTVAPGVAVVEADGGRLPIRPDAPSHRREAGSLWKEDKVGVRLTMASEVSEVDPGPEVPACFLDADTVTTLAMEVGQVARPAGEIPAPEPAEEEPGTRPGCPEPLVRTVLATRRSIDEFGPLLASAAFARNFPAAGRKAFRGDGSAGHWGIQQRLFASDEPILDFVPALTSVYAAAMAGRSFAAGWPVYREAIGWVWSGQVHRLIETLRLRQEELGEPSEGEPETSPARVVAEAKGDLTNPAKRMDYARYRRLGLPITSSAVESTIKQINQRVKGSEKFGSDPGSEAILQLRADYLSETPEMDRFWERRAERLNGYRPYRKAA